MIVQLTDDIFFGFKIKINIDNFKSVFDICNYVKNKLIELLEENNFELLLDRANRMKLHIHNYKNIHEIKNNENSILYVCSNKCYLDYN